MDKSDQKTYCSGKQVLVVERHFSGEKRIEEIVKQYISEQLRKMPGTAEAAAACAGEDGE